MKTFKVTFSDPRIYSIEVDAENQEEAEEKANDIAINNPEELTPSWDNDEGLVFNNIEEVK